MCVDLYKRADRPTGKIAWNAIVEELSEKYKGSVLDTYDKGVYSYTLSMKL